MLKNPVTNKFGRVTNCLWPYLEIETVLKLRGSSWASDRVLVRVKGTVLTVLEAFSGFIFKNWLVIDFSKVSYPSEIYC